MEGNAECGPSLADLSLPLVEGGGGSRAGGWKRGGLEAQRVGNGLPRTHTREVGRQQEASPHISPKPHLLMLYCPITLHLQNTNSRIMIINNFKTVTVEQEASSPLSPRSYVTALCHMSMKLTLMESEFAGDITVS